MKQSIFRRYSILGQAGLWLILFMINFMAELPGEGVIDAILYSLTGTAYLIPIVYLHYFKLLPLFHQGKRWVYFTATFVLISLIITIYYFIDVFIHPNYSDELLFRDYFTYDFLLSIIVVIVSSLYYFVEAWHENIKTESLLRNEKLQAELNFLKSQINPHFLFNTLNNIYSYAQTGNKKTAPMLERLSSILRYMVYDCGEDRVPLNKELNAVEDLLEINKMKNSEQRNIKLSVNGVKGFHLIAPLIIVNIVENACKHSDAVSNPKGFIDVRLSVDKMDNCLCEISNSIKKKVLTASKYGGVGFENVKKRLDLQYGESHTLEEVKNENKYHLKLNIPLERKK
ncbi:MAG: hypothetical protein GY705_27770 [Bacteroidetes bacterium]|nr:hypothetical protein [Bacteroidota bacterium]